jgi:hypothetical protein
MKIYKDKEGNLYEDTGLLKIHNYPSYFNTYTYITKVYKKSIKGKFGWTEVDGDPIYLKELPKLQQTLACIFGTSHQALSEALPIDSFLELVDDNAV